MPLTVAALLALPGLDQLPVLAGRRHLADRTITWAHVIELADPTPWLQGGELVLTTGLALGPDEDVQRDYVRRLAGAGAAALGFGTGLSHETVPPAVCAQADELGLPLFEVPRPVPFLAVIKAVAGRLAAEQYETVQRAVEAQRRLTRAAVDRGLPGILAALIRLVPGWALVLDRRGQVLAAHPPDAGPRRCAPSWPAIPPAPPRSPSPSPSPTSTPPSSRWARPDRGGGAIWPSVSGRRRPRWTGSWSATPHRWWAWNCSAR